MQGREVDIVVLSCVRSGSAGLGFLSDWRRTNVALSRAKEAIVVVGSESCLSRDARWERALRGFDYFETCSKLCQRSERNWG